MKDTENDQLGLYPGLVVMGVIFGFISLIASLFVDHLSAIDALYFAIFPAGIVLACHIVLIVVFGASHLLSISPTYIKPFCRGFMKAMREDEH